MDRIEFLLNNIDKKNFSGNKILDQARNFFASRVKMIIVIKRLRTNYPVISFMLSQKNEEFCPDKKIVTEKL